MTETTTPNIPQISFPISSAATGAEFLSVDTLLRFLNGEASGLYLVGSKGMWHGGMHITDATAPWCALTGNAAPEKAYAATPHKGVQHLRCMADGEIVAYRVCKDSPTIPWTGGDLYLSGSFVLVRHCIQPGPTAASGLAFYTLHMHLAPFSAYASHSDPRQRKTKNQKYYPTLEDAEANKPDGKFSAGDLVTVGDAVAVRALDNRQFSQVIIKNGALVWTACDGGFLSMPDSAGAGVPPWWSQCSPAYSVTPSTAAVFNSNTALSYYRTQENVLAEVAGARHTVTRGKPDGRLPSGTPMTLETDNALQTVTRSDSRVFKLMTMTADVRGTPLKRGERVWVVADGGNLEAVSTPATGDPKFDEVVVAPAPIAIPAGGALGHMGFFQIPHETGSTSRYMVHIECLTMDDNLKSFLTNPEGAGRDTPAFLHYPAEAPLFNKDAQDTLVDAQRKTLASAVIPLADAPAHPAGGTPAHYSLPAPEHGYIAAASVEKLSQYDLGKRGFTLIEDDPASFQLLDDDNQPQNVVKSILEKLHDAAENDPLFAHALARHQYQQLLDIIDANGDGKYSTEEYRRAVQNPVYRNQLYQLIAKHPSEWYFEKTDAKWRPYLEKLAIDAPKWKTYTEAFLDKMTWMKQVPGMGPNPWHMHPVMFMGALKGYANWFDIERFISIYKEQHSTIFGFYDNGKKISIQKLKPESENSLRVLLNEMKSQYYNHFDEFNEKFISYMLATVRVESYDYMNGVFFRPISEGISFDDAENNYGSSITAHNRQRAILNHNTENGDGYKYRGRGLVQLTWKINYEHFREVAGEDIVKNPDLCLNINISVAIMMKGMRDGEFRSGHTLERYLGENKNDYYNARLIINGLSHGIPDKANEFEDFAKSFEGIINEAM